MESLRSEVAKAQEAVNSEQQLAERLRKEAAAASASAQRQVPSLKPLRHFKPKATWSRSAFTASRGAGSAARADGAPRAAAAGEGGEGGPSRGP